MNWSKVQTAADCVECANCSEPFCDICDTHYADCHCIGPTQDDEYEYKTDAAGVMWAKPLDEG